MPDIRWKIRIWRFLWLIVSLEFLSWTLGEISGWNLERLFIHLMDVKKKLSSRTGGKLGTNYFACRCRETEVVLRKFQFLRIIFSIWKPDKLSSWKLKRSFVHFVVAWKKLHFLRLPGSAGRKYFANGCKEN